MALEHEIFQKKKYYKHLVEYLTLHIIGKPDKLINFHIYQLCANYVARVMYDTPYLLAIDIISTEVKFLGKFVDKAAFIMPLLLKSSRADSVKLFG